MKEKERVFLLYFRQIMFVNTLDLSKDHFL